MPRGHALAMLLTATLTAGRAAAAEPSHPVATHSTTGIVVSMSATSLVIRHGLPLRREMTFTLGPSTLIEGSITAGTDVSVRYEDAGRAHVASAVSIRKHVRLRRSPTASASGVR